MRETRAGPGAARALSHGAAALAGIGCAGAGSERAAPPPATATPLFWHAQAPAAGDFYLLGSVHVRAADAPAFGPEVAQAYQRSDQLVVEIDVSQITPDEIEAQTQRYALLPPQLGSTRCSSPRRASCSRASSRRTECRPSRSSATSRGSRRR